ncbi:MAG: putative ATP-dependent helicase DinG [Acidimicrobiales bacterium]|nr:MAG: ATP-dependent DNA helicase [Actinomycetota bacterium]MBV6507544.1 putative ATP-dependent helicase DinG [Acidimicrobiales bacterium]RIK07484.1 MAG: ATP-dependent helicase [Acidobacteriota bacterium]
MESGTETVLDALDAITAALPGGGERREGQRTMAGAVARAIIDRRHLLVQAGTGTGKSLAYLVPALVHGRRTIVATATKALQDQLAGKDLPFLREHLGRPFSFAILKGRSNYVCLQRLDELDDDTQLGLEGLATKPTVEELALIEEWAVLTPTGDRADLTFEPSPSAWAAVSVGPRECPGASKCPRGEECFTEAARDRAAVADVVIVNTHLYGLHLASGGVILPEHDVVVIDEVHQFEDIISATTGVDLSPSRLRAFRRSYGALIADEQLADAIETSADVLTGELAQHLGRRLRSGPPAGVSDALGRCLSLADRAMETVRKIDDGGRASVATRKARAITAATALMEDLEVVLRAPSGYVTWVEGSDASPHLRVAPVDVGETLRTLLWDSPSVEDSASSGNVDGADLSAAGFAEPPPPDGGIAVCEPPPNRPTAIMTSATVATSLPDRIGLAGFDHERLDVGSPFDYENNALLYCAAHLPDPRSERFADATYEELERLIVAADGRTLALFTSWKAMTAAADHLDPRLPWRVLRQDELPKPALLAAFGGDEHACLFATMSFWQGVDIPGPALSLVTIDKLPFPRPDDPLLQARREQAGAAAFSTVDLPRAATLLAQGAGRLIRRADDRGVVAVLDSRLATNARYRWKIVNALPPMRRTKDPEGALEFLRRL